MLPGRNISLYGRTEGPCVSKVCRPIIKVMELLIAPA